MNVLGRVVNAKQNDGSNRRKPREANAFMAWASEDCLLPMTFIGLPDSNDMIITKSLPVML